MIGGIGPIPMPLAVVKELPVSPAIPSVTGDPTPLAWGSLDLAQCLVGFRLVEILCCQTLSTVPLDWSQAILWKVSGRFSKS